VNGEANWLENYIQRAIDTDKCTKIYCTTCGAAKFREGLASEGANAVQAALKQSQIKSATSETIEKLRQIQPHVGNQWTDAVRLILFLLDKEVSPKTLDQQLSDSWAGELLLEMRKHYKERLDASHEHDERNDPVKAAARREQKRKEKQKKHLERLERKKIKDKSWFEHNSRKSSADEP
jgi:hypothetical protein